MSGTPFDPAALEARLDKKFDRMFAQLTTITNRLNSHDRRMARIESGKPDAGKGTDGTDDHVGDDVSDVGEEEDTRGSERDRAWATFCDCVIHEHDGSGRGPSRERDHYDRRDYGGYDRDFYIRGGRDFDRGGRDFDRFDRRGRDFDRYNRGGRDFDRFDRGGRDFDRGGRDFDRAGHTFGRMGRDYD